MKRPKLKRALTVLYAVIFAVLTVLFFTNDFGLVDLRKTAVVIGVALDKEDGEISLTAQLAVPKPAENGENTDFNVGTGKGATVAAALNEVNVKTGFYPKLVFCKLIILGSSCLREDITALLDYFYRNEYTGLTLLVAACEGSAKELISQKFPCGNSATDVIEKLLSSEAEASGNVSAVTLKSLGEKCFSAGGGAYMPYLENGVMPESGSGESSGGGGGGASGGGSGGGSGGECQESELDCSKCAIFSRGVCKGVLTSKQAFAFNILTNDVKHAFVESGEGEEKNVLGLRSCKGGVSLSFEGDRPVLKASFGATVSVQDGKGGFDPKQASSKVPDEILRRGEETIAALIGDAFEVSRAADSDIFGAYEKLYKYHYGRYESFKENLLDELTLKCEIKLKSAG